MYFFIAVFSVFLFTAIFLLKFWAMTSGRDRENSKVERRMRLLGRPHENCADISVQGKPADSITQGGFEPASL